MKLVNENPFDIHRELISHIITLRNDTAPNGWFNHNFKDRPSGSEVEHYVDMLHVKCELQETLKNARLRNKYNMYVDGDEEGFFITFSMDKAEFDKNIGKADEPFGPFNHSKIKDCMMKVLDSFRDADYKWCSEPIACCEFYSTSGFNPHIHIICKRNVNSKSTPATIRQGLQRKFQKEYQGKPNKKNFGCYNVNMKKLAFTHGENYVNGFKTERQDKLAHVKEDEVYRNNYNYAELYTLYDKTKID